MVKAFGKLEVEGPCSSLSVKKVIAKYCRQENSSEKPHCGTQCAWLPAALQKNGAAKVDKGVRAAGSCRQEQWGHKQPEHAGKRSDGFSQTHTHDPVIPVMDTYQENIEHMFKTGTHRMLLEFDS